MRRSARGASSGPVGVCASLFFGRQRSSIEPTQHAWDAMRMPRDAAETQLEQGLDREIPPMKPSSAMAALAAAASIFCSVAAAAGPPKLLAAKPLSRSSVVHRALLNDTGDEGDDDTA